ncbi:MAG TPA: type II toxin-antitoxin system VapC family toxin [Saprospiraceae bacterium]|nr:type II toxin-antitoxin system VapC family toxin [Saprospiraceae bacterium]HND86725.1 type II toxin-antitoxin system VapC family toxin [Saprospiraceae bacterium]
MDSNVIILISKGKLDTELLLKRYDEFWVSILTVMEVYGYDFDKVAEREIIDEFFSNLEVLDVDIRIAERVVEYRRSPKRKIKLPDAIILATASFLGAELLTGDWDDFLHIDSEVLVTDVGGFLLEQGS